MKKRKKGRKFSRERNQRRALRRSLLESLFLNERIKTTEAKAKEISASAEKMITKARKEDLNVYRYLARYFKKNLVKKIIKEIAPRYKERKGGYTRIIKVEPRKKDNAKMAIIELIK